MGYLKDTEEGVILNVEERLDWSLLILKAEEREWPIEAREGVGTRNAVLLPAWF
jgi:hypothetical protein